MNNSDLFKAAHKMTKEVIQAGDSYQITFGACLTAVRTGGIQSFLAFCLTLAESTFRLDGRFVSHRGFSGRARNLDTRAYSKKEWRRLLQKAHPDKGGDTEFFAYISQVYTVTKRHCR